MYKGPEAGTGLACSRNNKGQGVVGEGELGELGSGAGHTHLETKVRHLDFILGAWKASKGWGREPKLWQHRWEA